MTLTAVIQHGKTVIIAFDNRGNNRCDGSDQGNQRQEQDKNCKNGLPETIAQCQFYSPFDIMQKNSLIKNKCPAFNNGFCFFTEVSKNRTAQDQKQLLKKG